MRVVHPERGEDAFFEKSVEPLAGDRLDGEAEDIGADVGVHLAGARLARKRRGHDDIARLPRTRSEPPKVATSRQAAGVREQVPDGYVVFRAPRKRREVLRDGGIELEPPFIVQDHCRGSRAYDLRQRREVVDRLVRHDGGAARGPPKPSVSLFEH